VSHAKLPVAGFGAALLVAILLATLGIVPGTTAGAHAAEVTGSQDNLRSGWDRGATGLSPSVVSGSTFGPLPGFPVRLNGQIYAQPLVIGNIVIVATENDMVYGIDGTSGQILWSRSLGRPYAIKGCNNIAPNIGITSSPVYDPGTGDVYVMTQIEPKTTPLYTLFGLNPSTGAQTSAVGVPLHPSNDSHLTFHGATQLQRPGLLLVNGWVYAAFGSHCDHQPYAGFVTGINVATRARTMWSDETGLTDNQAGIWQSGGGMASDGTGRLFFTSGNGISPAPGAGARPPGQLAESIVRLGVNSSTGALSAKNFFSPANAPALDAADTDWGSGGPIALPFSTSGTSSHGLIVQAGKDGRVYVLDRNNLGGREQGARSGDAFLAKAGPYAGQWGHPAAFADTTSLTAANSSAAHDYLYFIGRKDFLRVLKFGATSSGLPTMSDVANSSAVFGYGSGGPVVTSSGTDPASAVVWAVSAAGGGGSAGTLRAYAAAPSASCSAKAQCSLSPIFSAPTGSVASFATPATSNSSVYVGTLGGQLYGFGIKPAAAALAGPAAAFSQTGVGSAATKVATVAASRNITVTGVSSATTSANVSPAASEFTVDASKATETRPGSSKAHRVTFPVNLRKGDHLSAPVTFTPAAAGGVTGTLSFATPGGPLPATEVSLAGSGTQPGFYANNPSAQFALVGDLGQFESWVPVGITVQRQITITNGGATPEKISTESLPQAPYKVTGVPPTGTVLAPGQSFVATVIFTPTVAGQVYNDTLSVGSSAGSAVVSLQGQSISPSSLFQASPSPTDFSNVPVGKQAKATVTITNIGNEPATMTGSSPLSAPFHAALRVTPQLPVNAGYNLHIPVTFTPPRKGAFAVKYRVSWTDVLGRHTLTVPIHGNAEG